ncbi:UxaA family hydrolase [Thermoanaerobacterium thermosaccharolyticum]|uniref:UxaA family hydrolase n=1 Tax=Thermoanaerobacterium thermosaccharolyticum TaxID=1517 RepID=UPI003DA84E61
MEGSINAIVIDKKYNVGVALENLKINDIAYFKIGNDYKTVKVIDEIPIYHKFALKDINKDDFVYKYGENIGKAIRNIKEGEHVHTHNLISIREGVEEQ